MESRKFELKIKPQLLQLQIQFSKFIAFPLYTLIEFLKKESEENPFLQFNYGNIDFNEIPLEIPFTEELMEQIKLMDIPEKMEKIAEFIIMNLEENGYLKMELKEVAEILKVDIEEVEKTLKIVQSLEPAGVGARNLKECFLIQIRRYHKDWILDEMVDKYWDILIKKNFKEISNKMGISEEDVKFAFEKLKKLNPYPISDKRKIIKRIIPEGRIEKIDGKFKVYLDDKISSYIKIETDYEKYVNFPFLSAKEKKFFEDKIKKVKLIIEMIEKRKKFLEKVFEEIINYQSEFFETGDLLPLKEKDIAEKMNVSISTISRAINGKYLLSPVGLLKIKDLFTPEFKHYYSKQFIMKKIKEIIENEKDPLTDKEIALKLGYMGIKISRRTVNKYRNQLKILNSYLRDRKNY